MSFTATLVNPQQAHQVLSDIWPKVKAYVMGGNRLHLEIKKETRSLAQNDRLWAMLTDVSRQVVWHGVTLSPSEWKDVFTAGLKKQKAVPGLDGGFVVVGMSTSKMTVAEMGDLMTLIEAFGAERGVEFHEQQTNS